MKRFLTTVLAIVLLLVGIVYLSAFAFAAKLDKQPRASTSGQSKLGVTNILLVGVDGESDGVRGDGAGRSDTMLLLSIDRLHGKLKLSSFMRDSWLAMPDGHADKLNAAFHNGGAEALMQTISGSFDVKIDHYAVLNFTGFAAIIDALGGIAVPVTKKEAQFLCSTTRLGKQIGLDNMLNQMQTKGTVDMTGEQALIYCRIRKLDDDFQRTQRQRKVLGIIFSKMKHSPLRLAFTAGKFLPYIQTDMSQAAIAAMAVGAPLYLSYEVLEHQVPAQGTWYYDRRNGQSVIIVDLGTNSQLLQEFMFE